MRKRVFVARDAWLALDVAGISSPRGLNDDPDDAKLGRPPYRDDLSASQLVTETAPGRSDHPRSYCAEQPAAPRYKHRASEPG